MTRTYAIQTDSFEISYREIGCFLFALGLHCLLLLWKGGAFQVLNKGAGDLGESLVEVGYVTEMPSYPDAGAPGEAGQKTGGLFSAVKQFFKTGTKADQEKKADDVAMGKLEDKIGVDKSKWDKTENNLVDKAFSGKKEFSNLVNKPDMAVVAGETTNVLDKPISQGSEVAAQPNLKEKTYQVAMKDVPFKVLKPKSVDSLENVNMVPITVGKTTDRSVRSLDAPEAGGAQSAPALKQKAFAGGASSGGFGKSGSSSGGSGGGGGIVPGAGSGTGISGSGPGGGGSVPGATGQGSGGGSGMGGGSGRGGGRGVGFGGVGGGGGTAMLPRRTVAADAEVVKSEDKSSKGAGFQITGALANRPIQRKVLIPYEMDARVALRVRVDWSGHVLDGIIVEISSGSPTFDQKVLTALKNWLFSKLSPDRINEIQEGVITFTFRGV
jgi:TonB family protein